jgi:hypothetical protein
MVGKIELEKERGEREEKAVASSGSGTAGLQEG